MKRQPGQGRDTGGIENGHSVATVLIGESGFECRTRRRQLPRLEEESPSPCFEHLVGPALSVTLRLLEAAIGDIERLHVVVEDAEDLAAPHVSQTKPLVVVGIDAFLMCDLNQLL